jgi:hypothetical protein
MTPARKMLSDMGMWLGTDVVAFVKIRAMIEAIEESETEKAKEFMQALELVHKFMERAKNV